MTGQVRRGAIQGQRKEQEQGKASWPFFGGYGQDRSIFSMGVWHFLGTFSLNSPKVNHIILYNFLVPEQMAQMDPNGLALERRLSLT